MHVDTSAVLDEARIQAMLCHRSMRIDGATFQGRPLGHRLDPLRCELSFDDAALWDRTVRRILDEHRFRQTGPAANIGSDLTVLRGRFYDTMLWQSSAFAEFGYGPHDDFRDDPAVESVQGPASVVMDRRAGRTDLQPDDRDGLRQALTETDARVVLLFRGKDLSGTGGIWRSFFRDHLSEAHRDDAVSMIAVSMLGTEALTCLVLTATLVYLDLAHELSFRTLQYR